MAPTAAQHFAINSTKGAAIDWDPPWLEREYQDSKNPTTLLFHTRSDMTRLWKWQ
jgi:hypothetical protein